ncbi:MAG: IPTL-CTERM sorting domain-containing protein [Comamonas sp.]
MNTSMQNLRGAVYKKTRLYGALAIAFSAMGSGQAQAAPNDWVGPGDVTVGTSWQAGVLASGGANVINSSSPPAPWNVTSTVQSFNTDYGLYVGHGTGGVFNIKTEVDASSGNFSFGSSSDPDMPPLSPADPLFRVGDAGGSGTVSMDVRTAPVGGVSGYRLLSGSVGLGVGLGAGSAGLVTVLGAGKTPEELGYASTNSVVFGYPTQNTAVGQLGGKGHVQVDGASLVFQTGEANQPNSSEPVKYFAIGDGVGGTGSVNVLGSGKLASGSPVYGDTSQKGGILPFSFIGKDAGFGVVTVEPTASGFANQADFYTGLAVGTNNGAGVLDILEGGKSLITNGSAYSATEGYCQVNNAAIFPLAPATLQISADNTASGIVRVKGAATELLVSGKSGNDYSTSPINTALIQEHSIGRVQIGTGGALVTTDSATVKIGINRLFMQNVSSGSPYFTNSVVGGIGPVNVSGSGSVVYGSETATAAAAGKIEASQINLTAATAQVKFNHTGNLNFDLPLSGNGKLVQQAGSTVISASLVGLPVLDPAMWKFDTVAPCIPAVSASYPTNQAGFTGGLDVQGGTLVLPATNVLPGLTATNIGGGTLAQGGTSQNLGAVTQAGGVLQLTGGGTPGATDTASASNWAGSGGVVQLDTVLGADGSASDKIHIAGPISGTTLLQISNLGGVGAQTTGNGILVVQADSANAANSFVLASPVTVGGIQYKLQQVGNNWYLQSVAPGQLTINKIVNAPAGTPYSGDISFTVSCTNPASTTNGTIPVNNNQGSATPITLAAGSQCTVSEQLPAAPAGYQWMAPTYQQPAGAITEGGVETATITNTLTPIATTTGQLLINTSVAMPSGALPYSGNIGYTLACTNPVANYSGNIVVANNQGSAASITVATGSQCIVAQSLPSAPAGYAWSGPVYTQAGLVGDGTTVTANIANTLSKEGMSTAKPVPALGQWALMLLSGMFASFAAWRLRQRRVS